MHLVTGLKLLKLCLLLKIHKRLFHVPGRPAIYGFYIENIFSFLDFHSQDFSQNGKSYEKTQATFWEKLKNYLLEYHLLFNFTKCKKHFAIITFFSNVRYRT